MPEQASDTYTAPTNTVARDRFPPRELRPVMGYAALPGGALPGHRCRASANRSGA
jgi:hypothetical protein